MRELELTEQQIFSMVSATARVDGMEAPRLSIVCSDSYGPHLHRTWVFSTSTGEIIGSLERYWGGLKMICSVFGDSPRTNFFMEDGTKTTNKGLKSQ